VAFKVLDRGKRRSTQRLPSARAQVEGSTGGDSPRGIALLPRLK